MSEVRATVRLQFHKEFTLDHAIPLIAYFNKLGISHIYSSPLLKARSGSMHGYDVIDPTRINPELGGEPALKRFVAELRKYDMGLIVDIVSNHMAVGGKDNPWWQNVLQWGLKSPYSQFFDIQWSSPDPLLKGQLLVPFLRAGYGEVLAAGDITLHFDYEQAVFYVHHGDHRFPLYPPSYSEILRNTDNDSFTVLIPAFEALEQDPEGWKHSDALHDLFRTLVQTPDAKASIEKALTRYDVTLTADDQNASSEASAKKINRDTFAGDIHPEWEANENLQRLHKLLELQHYRLASWMTAADDINWRRFFDINELGAIRVERADVFDATHAKIFELIEQGLIDGLRIDHIDGLANPRAYCRKLRRCVDALIRKRPQQLSQTHFPIYVEKILADGEKLIQDWDVDGTTGYEFMNQVSLLQHDPSGEQNLNQLWVEVSGRTGKFEEEVKAARLLVLSSTLAGDVEMVAQGLLLVARTDIATRDLTLGALRRALVELVANFPVYRTYAGACGRSEQDQLFFDKAVEGAKAALSETDWPILNYLDRWLGGQALHSLPPGRTRKLRRKVLTRFQQLTSPAAAKAVEDTACYRSAVLLSRNDVGFDPQNFSGSVSEFHQLNAERAQYFPNNLLTTATHDHKRGEDTRARLAVISERSEWFAEKIHRWFEMAAPLRVELTDGVAPSPGDELMLYQILLGSWPLTLTPDNKEAMQAYLERLLRWQEKAMREAKLCSTWTTPNIDYEAGSRNFLTQLLTHETTTALRNDLISAAMSLAPAGALNGLVQSLLRMTSPGTPDLYQGTEFWDFSLVDPDNRQPVDFSARVNALNLNANPTALLQDWHTGQIKQWLIANTLRLRSAHMGLFSQGSYEPLEVQGEQADHVVAFIRQHDDEYLIVIAPRFSADFLVAQQGLQIPATKWGDTAVVLPPKLVDAFFLDGLCANKSISPRKDRLVLQDALADLPFNILCFKPLN